MLNLLGAVSGATWELPFEIPFIMWLQSLGGKGSVLYYIMNFFSMLGEEIVLVGVLGLLFWGVDKESGKRIGLFLVTATLLTPLLKHIFCRSRPFVAHSDKVQNLRNVDGYSFPSGHSSGSASVFFGSAITYKNKKWKWLWAIGIIIPVLVAISRNYVGAHYPTDVVAGLALGVVIVLLFNMLYNRINKYWLYGALLIVGFAGFFYCTESDFFTGYGLALGFTFGLLFEEKITKFENTKVWWRILLRVVIGGALFLGLNEGIKAIVGLFGESVVVDGETLKWYETTEHIWFERIFRVLRFAVVVFLQIGVYPLLFAPTEKLWRKLGWLKENTTDSALEEPETNCTTLEESDNVATNTDDTVTNDNLDTADETIN